MTLLARRIPTVFGVLILIAGIGFGIYYVRGKQLPTNTDAMPQNVRITNVADNKFTVSWITPTAASGKVKYGKAGEKLVQEIGDDRDIVGSEAGNYLTHHVTIGGLQPTTAYAFRIESGKGVEFDNNGSPYAVTTGPTIAATPPAETIYGQVQQASTLPAEGAVVYLTLPGAAPASTLVKSSGSYAVPVSILRTTDLLQYANYDPTATILSIIVESGKQQTKATVSTANAAPVPLLTLGKDADFTTSTPAVIAQVEPEGVAETEEVNEVPSPTPSQEPVGERPSILNLEPLGSGVVGGVKLINPGEDGERITTARPEFRGLGPKATVLSVTVQSPKTYRDSVVIAEDGTWTWTPPSDLTAGEHTVTIAFIDASGVEQTIKRTFTVQPALAAEPAFVATPSATVKPTATAKPVVTATPKASESPVATTEGRSTIPATESGVPVTGVWQTTLLTLLAGFVIMVGGAILFAL